ncbi:hypothetical protein [Streptomyces tsukubensis]|uniref:Uncharacterized protein n=1 Tax=Streptomyces tsukubensis TaxID=83656 RepID=A0A1V4A469_9ACTN|nr:hypothetical protein [Streptomyces tsukubensis]OON75362.1 hypothetical protein B1H18_23030 [Streptomyces tsukubensis]
MTGVRRAVGTAVRERKPRVWSERELRLVDRLAELHEELDAARRDRAGLIAYVLRLHAGSVGPPDAAGWSAVNVDTAAGRLSWRVAPEDAHFFREADGGRRPVATKGPRGSREQFVETLTRLSFLHLHRRPNLPTRTGRNA